MGRKPSDSSTGASETPLFKSVHCLDSTFQAKPSIRCFIKPTETLERSLEMNKHKGKRRVQKRPNYKNVGEEEDEEKGPAEDAQEDAEKAKGTEGGSKGLKTSGENEGECTRRRQPARRAVLCLVPVCVPRRACHSRHLCTSLCTARPLGTAVARSVQGLLSSVGSLERGPVLLTPASVSHLSKESIYFVIKRMKWANARNMLRTVPGPYQKYLPLQLFHNYCHYY